MTAHGLQVLRAYEAAYSGSGTLIAHAHRRLTTVLQSAQRIPFDDSSRFVLFSDSHRGNNGRIDAFAQNESLFLSALNHYYQGGYTYIEVGDGDELWKTWTFQDIRLAHGSVFDLMHRFDREGRLHLVLGNHDIRDKECRRVDKDGLVAHEAWVLRHSKTGQEILVVHGHQADLASDHLYRFSRLVVSQVWRRLQLLGLAGVTGKASHIWRLKKIEQTIFSWIKAHGQIVICGHTHRPMSAVHGAPPYFNTGSCVIPGLITGLEIQDGEVSLVSWSSTRQLLAAPRKLRALLISPASRTQTQRRR
jgi:UDP-2,3-diacylglucosamine pyrophosphatase LpxH